MRLLGFNITRQKATMPVDSGRSWYPLVRESQVGAWQRNITVDRASVTSFHAIFSCATLIASDIAKLRIKLCTVGPDDVWTEKDSPAYSPVLRKPNAYQTWSQFIESWLLSKVLRGNAYILKIRDNRNVVVQLKVLDGNRVRPLVADDGSVYYRLAPDNMVGVGESVDIPASEIIHDRFNCLFHPLVGLTPIYANGLAATQGLSIQNNSAAFFSNNSRPGGILVAPSKISQQTADELKANWNANYTGLNNGKVAVLGDGLKYEAMSVDAVDAQLVEQLKWTSEVVCSTFHVPPYKIGVGALPSYNNVQALNVEYFSQCLQKLMDDVESSLDFGLELPKPLRTKFEERDLLRMDSVTQMQVLKEGVSAGVYSPNEARAQVDLPPVEGGETPYLQQQNYSLEALAKRDAKEDPFGTAKPTPAPPQAANDQDQAASAARGLLMGRDLKAALRLKRTA